MAQFARMTRNLKSIAATSTRLAETAGKISETAIASGTVIGHRVALGAQALQNPLAADTVEFTRMSTEKIAAFTASGNAVLGDLQAIGAALVKLSLDQNAAALRAASALARARTPFAAWEAQRRWLLTSLARANQVSIRLAALSSGVSAKALAPVHKTATRNARRLTRKA